MKKRQQMWNAVSAPFWNYITFNNLLMNVLMRVHEDAQIGFCWQLSRWLMGNYELVSSLIAPQALQQPSLGDLYLLWSEQKMARFSRKKKKIQTEVTVFIFSLKMMSVTINTFKKNNSLHPKWENAVLLEVPFEIKDSLSFFLVLLSLWSTSLLSDYRCSSFTLIHIPIKNTLSAM